ncbi:hypothetical protein PUR_11080 [Paenibacillus sp. URB8-2]|nr:hypothetical protein PUR_11080 [Paenibacillus sp. URB8-2]
MDKKSRKIYTRKAHNLPIFFDKLFVYHNDKLIIKAFHSSGRMILFVGYNEIFEPDYLGHPSEIEPMLIQGIIP